MLPDAPYWQPISMLSMVAAIIDGVAEDARHRQALLARVVGQTSSLTEARELWRWAQYVAPDAQFYMQQLMRWQSLELTPDQATEVARLVAVVAQLAADVQTITEATRQ